MKTSLHQDFRSTLFDQIDCFLGRVDPVRRVDDFEIAEIEVRRSRRLLDPGGRTHEYRFDESCLCCFDCASQSRVFTRVGHCGGNGCETLASLQQLFILARSCFRAHLSSCFAAAPVSFNSNVSTMAISTPKSIGRHARWKCGNSSCEAPPETCCRLQPNTGPSKALKVKVRKLTTTGAVP